MTDRWQAPLGGLALAIVAGFICAWVHTPLPWMIGPLFAVAGARLAGVEVTGVAGGRYAGQWIIGSALGLYFTPIVVRQVISFAPWMVVAGVYALMSGVICGLALARIANVDGRTAFFASVPGGATEMSILAERFGARTDLVAVAQSLRILIVVSAIPFVFASIDVHGADPYVQGTRQFSWIGLLELMGLTALGGAALHRFRFPNGWVIGALAVSLPLTALQIEFSSLPTWLSNVGQLLIGCSLATRFQQDFLARTAVPGGRDRHRAARDRTLRRVRAAAGVGHARTGADDGIGDGAGRHRRDGDHCKGAPAWRPDRHRIPCRENGATRVDDGFAL